MPTSNIRILGLPGIREVVPGDDLASLLLEAIRRIKFSVGEGDIFVIAQKVVSKAEGRVVQLESVTPSATAHHWAAAYNKDPRVLELILGETRRIVRMDRGILIVETRNGFVCANAGVDTSNAADGTVTLLPEDPDQSARRLRAQLQATLRARLGVIISDTFGRPWLEGLVIVALGVAGLDPLIDLRGHLDTRGRTLQHTIVAVADEIAAAAELVMGKTNQVPAAIIQGFVDQQAEDRGRKETGSGRDLLRSQEQDLFR